VVFYEALSGRHPFLAGSFMATSDRILHEVPAPLTRLNPKVPAELERIVAKMLAKDQAERYATAADLLVDLRAVQRVGPYPAPLPPRALSAPRRGKWWALAAAVGVLLVVGIGLLPKMHRPDRWFGPRVVAGPKVLAVLPFQAIGGAPENQAYSDGITGTLTAQLTWLTPAHALQVVPPSEVHARHVSSAGEARKELGVNLVLEGTLDRSGNAVRVNYALVDAVTLRQLRAETITAEASDPFAVQDRVAEGLVKMLELELNPQERQALQTHGTQVAGAYDFYLQGHGYLQNYDRPENIENAISVFQRALSLDPNYSLAHAGLGEAYWRKYEVRKEFHWIEPARKACGRALALDEKLAAAHICLGTLDNGTGQYGSATAEFHRALETEPTSDDAYRGLGFAYEHLGKLAEAERTHRQAIDLRPQYWGGYSWLGAFYFRQARYSDAAEMFKHVVALVPDSFRAYNNLGGTYIHMGRYNDAVAVLQRSVAIRPNAIGYSNLATAYFHQRQFAEAARTFEEAVKLDQRDYQLWGNLGDAYFWAPGKRADAVRAYQKAITLARENLPINPRDAHLLGDLANYHALLQERSAATAYLGQALKIAPNDGDLRFKAALVYNELGETGKALEWLGKALAAGYSPSKVHDTPNFDHLRSNPRFQELFRGK
jgi:tetratricopeptide (TPR) repeat protein